MILLGPNSLPVHLPNSIGYPVHLPSSIGYPVHLPNSIGYPVHMPTGCMHQYWLLVHLSICCPQWDTCAPTYWLLQHMHGWRTNATVIQSHVAIHQ